VNNVVGGSKNGYILIAYHVFYFGI